jgi:hypothetical protein
LDEQRNLGGLLRGHVNLMRGSGVFRRLLHHRFNSIRLYDVVTNETYIAAFQGFHRFHSVNEFIPICG